MSHNTNDSVISVISKMLLMSALIDIEQYKYADLSEKYTFVPLDELMDMQTLGIQSS